MNHFFSNGYSAVGMDARSLRRLCHTLAADLPALLQKHDAQAVAVRGTSGVSVAFAMRMFADINVAVVRKPGENSHGMETEMTSAGENGIAVRNYIFLDDLVFSGTTFRAVQSGMGVAKCAALVLYGEPNAWKHNRVMVESKCWEVDAPCYRYNLKG